MWLIFFYSQTHCIIKLCDWICKKRPCPTWSNAYFQLIRARTDNWLFTSWTFRSIPDTRSMLVHDRKNQTHEIETAIKWQTAVECLPTFYQLFWLVECRMICKNTNAACINIYCSWGEVIRIFLVQTSHEFLEQLSGYLNVIVNGYPDSKRKHLFQFTCT